MSLLGTIGGFALGGGVGALAGSLAGGAPGAGSIPGMSELQDIGAPALAAGKSYLSSAQSGTLTAPQQAAVSQWQTGATSAMKQYLANAGILNSSTEVGSENQIGQQALTMSQGFLQQDFQNGLAALNLAQGPYEAMAGLQLQQDQQLQQAIGGALGAFGSLLGSGMFSGGGAAAASAGPLGALEGVTAGAALGGA